MKKVVTYAKLQTELFIPGLGGLGTTLPPALKNIPNLIMHYTELGLEITAGKHLIVVPPGNVVLAVTIPEPKEAVPSKK